MTPSLSGHGRPRWGRSGAGAGFVIGVSLGGVAHINAVSLSFAAWDSCRRRVLLAVGISGDGVGITRRSLVRASAPGNAGVLVVGGGLRGCQPGQGRRRPIAQPRAQVWNRWVLPAPVVGRRKPVPAGLLGGVTPVARKVLPPLAPQSRWLRARSCP
jgi:hypothetical protein